MAGDNAETTKVAFLGLGVMGYPMAGHLLRHGADVCVYNRSADKAAAWFVEYADIGRAKTTATVAEAVKEAEFVFMCVGNDDDVREVALGESGAIAHMSEGSLLIDHTTASQQVAIELARVAEKRAIGFLDAPVSGGQAGAENGALTVMVGGSTADFERAKPTIAAFAKKCELMGPVGSGQLTKMVNQICIAGVLQGLAEGIHFAQSAGLDVGAVVDVIAQGAAQSWQMENRAGTMAKGEFDFGFAVDWMRKDLSIALATGRQLNSQLPLTALVDQFYGDVQRAGGGRWDTSSLLTRLK